MLRLQRKVTDRPDHRSFRCSEVTNMYRMLFDWYQRCRGEQHGVICEGFREERALDPGHERRLEVLWGLVCRRVGNQLGMDRTWWNKGRLDPLL